MDQRKLQPVNCPAKIETGYCNNEASMVGAHFSVTFTDTTNAVVGTTEPE